MRGFGELYRAIVKGLQDEERLNELLRKHIKGYGLPDEALEEYARQIPEIKVPGQEEVPARFGHEGRIRIFELTPRDPFYSLLDVPDRPSVHFNLYLSNKKNCVIQVHRPQENLEEVLPHEFAHLYQFLEGFPLLVPRCIRDPPPLPGYVCVSGRIGPKKGFFYLDGMIWEPLNEWDSMGILCDFTERVGDFICECIIQEKGFEEAYHRYPSRAKVNPVPLYPPLYRRYRCRLSIMDVAALEAEFNTFYPDREIPHCIKAAREEVLGLDPKSGETIYRRVVELWRGLDYRSLRAPSRFESFVFSLMGAVGLEIRD
jgi:hypothetical protein